MPNKKTQTDEGTGPKLTAAQKRLLNLRHWSKGESGNPNGRPRSMLAILEDKVKIDFQVTLTKADKMVLIETMLELSISNLEKITKSKDSPAFVALVAKAIVTDFGTGSLRSVQAIFDRIYGKSHIQVPERPEEMDEIGELMKANSKTNNV